MRRLYRRGAAVRPRERTRARTLRRFVCACASRGDVRISHLHLAPPPSVSRARVSLVSLSLSEDLAKFARKTPGSSRASLRSEIITRITGRLAFGGRSLAKRAKNERRLFFPPCFFSLLSRCILPRAVCHLISRDSMRLVLFTPRGNATLGRGLFSSKDLRMARDIFTLFLRARSSPTAPFARILFGDACVTSTARRRLLFAGYLVPRHRTSSLLTEYRRCDFVRSGRRIAGGRRRGGITGGWLRRR